MAEDTQYFAIKKPAGATHIRNVFTAAECKMVNGCWATAQAGGLKQMEYEMSLHDLCSYLGIPEIKNKEWVKRVIVGLNTKSVQWNSLGKDKTKEWGTCVFLQSGKIRGRKFFFRISEEFLSWARDPRVYTRLRLAFIVQLNSKYAIALAEFLSTEMDTSNQPKAEEFIFYVSLADIKELLNLGKNQYPRYSNFRQHVLVPAIELINEHGDMHVEFDPVKEKTKVVGLDFKVRRKSVKQLSLVLPDLNLERAGETDLRLIKTPSEDVEEVLTILSECDIGKVKAADLLDKYTPEVIRRNIAYGMKDSMDGKVQKLSGYVIKAVEADYAYSWTTQKVNETIVAWRERNSEIKKNEERKRREEEARQQKQDFAKFREERRAQYLAEKSESWLKEKREAFMAENTSGLIRDQFEKEGWESSFVKAGVNAFIEKDLLKRPEEKDLDSFLRWRDQHGEQKKAS